MELNFGTPLLVNMWRGILLTFLLMVILEFIWCIHPQKAWNCKNCFGRNPRGRGTIDLILLCVISGESHLGHFSRKYNFKRLLYFFKLLIFLFFVYFVRFSTSKQLHINDHLKAHLAYKSCPRTLGTEDLVYGRSRTHDLVVGSPVP